MGLLAITVIQTFFTCYTQKFNVDHTLSVFPFIFYLWLGAFIRRMNYHEHFIKIPFRYLGFFIVVTGILATVESVYLLEHGYRNYFNVLRYSNQAYSIVFFVALVKIGTKVRIPRFLNPRKESFGIYLYHVFIIIFLYPHLSKAIEGVTGISLTSVSLLAIIPLEIFKFVVCYLISTILVKVLVKFKLLFLDLDNKREALKA